MKHISIRKIILLATTISGVMATSIMPAQAMDLSTRESSNKFSTHTISNSKSNVPSDVVHASNTSYDVNNKNNIQDEDYTYPAYWAQYAKENGWTEGYTYWYYINGQKHTFTVGPNVNTTIIGGINSSNVNNNVEKINSFSNQIKGGTPEAYDIASEHAGRTPYGMGNTPALWNCTGMTQYIYKSLGYTDFPWGYAETQRDYIINIGGQQVQTPQVGDYIYIANAGMGIGHAGIYAGDGLMLSAANVDQGTCYMPISSFNEVQYYRF